MISGNLLKMHSNSTHPVQYTLKLGEKSIDVNANLDKTWHISYTGEINCIHCGRKTKTSFAQGYCYPCFTTAPQTDPSVIRPELCQAHEGIARDMEWAQKNCLIDHFVYIAYTGSFKVGVTRHTQIPTRWIDQGAGFAIKLAQVPYRQLAGLIEVELKQHISDKTNWRKMLSDYPEPDRDLLDLKEELCELLPEEYQYYISEDDTVYTVNYPVHQYPEKIKSVNLDKTPEFSGKLTGIKGQYLLFDNGHVLNIRKHNGYKVNIEISD